MWHCIKLCVCMILLFCTSPQIHAYRSGPERQLKCTSTRMGSWLRRAGLLHFVTISQPHLILEWVGGPDRTEKTNRQILLRWLTMMASDGSAAYIDDQGSRTVVGWQLIILQIMWCVTVLKEKYKIWTSGQSLALTCLEWLISEQKMFSCFQFKICHFFPSTVPSPWSWGYNRLESEDNELQESSIFFLNFPS